MNTADTPFTIQSDTTATITSTGEVFITQTLGERKVTLYLESSSVRALIMAYASIEARRQARGGPHVR